jgi:hypothetical protein
MPLYTQLKTADGTPATVNWYGRYLDFMLESMNEETGKPGFDNFDDDLGYTFTRDHIFTEEDGTRDQTCWFIRAGDRFEAWR